MSKPNQRESANPKTNAEEYSKMSFPKRWKSTSLANQAIVILTFFLTLFTLILAGFTYWQICIYKKAVHIESRPYLVAEVDNVRDLDSGKTPMIRWRILNMGKTPAHQTNYHVTGRFGARPTTHEIDSCDALTNPNDGVLVGNNVLEGQTIVFPKFSGQNIVDLNANTSILAIWGSIVYKDEFGDPHFTRFMYKWVPEDSMMKATTDKHNYTDDEER